MPLATIVVIIVTTDPRATVPFHSPWPYLLMLAKLCDSLKTAKQVKAQWVRIARAR